ncbi:MAG: OB-fold nucleic acid binding domain-containing protein [Candidatus Bathyarchaeota archaeon]|nr:OB-fold nucleic acid binding domain-containing protein [Candidatus Bathyarchaeota archaeon]
MLHYGRGRPRGQRQSMAEMARLWYLIRVSEKHELETHKFLACFLDAWAHEKSSCKGISIQCRQKTKNDGVFLVTQGQKIITQLILSDTALKHMSDVDLASFPRNKFRSIMKIEKKRPVDMQIKDVNSGIKWVNLKAKVVEKSIAKTVYSRFGTPLSVSNATISDNTGFIKLPLWNDQIKMLSIGDMVQIENGRIRTYRGELQVSVSKKSKLMVIGNQSK